MNLALNFLLIPRYGIVGTALATAIAEGIMLAAYASAIARWGWRPTLRPLVRPAIAAATMAGVLLITPGTVHVMSRVVLGGLAYVAALGLAGGFPPEARRLMGLAGS